MSRARWLFVLAAACAVEDVEMEGKRCPCIEGFVCDTKADRCVRALGPEASVPLGPLAIKTVDRLVLEREGSAQTMVVEAAREDTGAVTISVEDVPGGVVVEPQAGVLEPGKPISFTLRALGPARTGTSDMTVRGFRETSPEDQQRAKVKLEVVGKAGAIDTAFGNDGLLDTGEETSTGPVSAAMLSDGTLAIALNRHVDAGVSHCEVVRYDVEGRKQPFGTAASVSFPWQCQAISTAAGEIVIAGAHENDGMTAVRLSEAGVLDTTFGSGGVFALQRESGASAAALLATGEVVLAGFTAPSAQSAKLALARLDAQGKLDAAFGVGGVLETTIDTFRQGQRVLLDGTSILVSATEPDGAGVVARVTQAGALDMTFGDAAGATKAGFTRLAGPSELGPVVLAHAADPGGSMLVAGAKVEGPPFNSTFTPRVARVTSAGVVDTSFGENGAISWPGGRSVQALARVSAERTLGLLAIDTSMALIAFDGRGVRDDLVTERSKRPTFGFEAAANPTMFVLPDRRVLVIDSASKAAGSSKRTLFFVRYWT